MVCSFKRRPRFWSQTRLDNGFVPYSEAFGVSEIMNFPG